ncbi:hypothetical protein [Alteromonas sp. KUL49]|uniref:hypothetical protein n=1 Tax=Alteromonas sp. KUL49 TaxID=2480798 RepID=UPI00102EEFAF|nr:hypothetical protein [Alteromonas sp. KUL49]TAP40693.1 hypothetical protein EYS00_06135 [Alteromonas sp. KUL49]GEA10861.1 hypothetical protein KUL49_12360 [Alteromonas sp. KUL49]
MFLAAALLGGGNLYMTVHGLRTLPYMNATITLSEDNITIKRGVKTFSVDWASVKKVQHVVSTQVLHLYGDDGKIFLSVTEQLKGFHLLVACLNEKSGLKI